MNAIEQAIDNTPNLRPQARTYDAVHPEYAQLTEAQRQETAFKKLEEYIGRGRKRVGVAVERIQREVPRDLQVRANTLKFMPGPLGTGILLGVGAERFGLHRHAMGQLVDVARPKVPIRFARELESTEWGLKLLCENLSQTVGHLSGDEQVVVRTVDGVARGIVSPSFRREDGGPALEALLTVAKEAGAVIADGYAGDIALNLKMMLAKPVEIFPGEWAVVGLDYSTGDFGGKARQLAGWILRLLCLNGAVTVGSFRRVHIGARSNLAEGVNFSEKTRDLDSRATASAIRDIGRALIGPEAVQAMIEKARAANAAQIDPQKVVEGLKGLVTKDEQKAIIDKFNSPDVVELPPGNTAWRWSNAISWLARETEDEDRKQELERLAGEAIAA